MAPGEILVEEVVLAGGRDEVLELLAPAQLAVSVDALDDVSEVGRRQVFTDALPHRNPGGDLSARLAFELHDSSTWAATWTVP
jgi:hypothetical protein